MEREAEIAGKLAETLDTLENRELEYKVAASGTANEIKRLIIESKNRTISEEQKINLLKRAHDMEVRQADVMKGINLDKMRVAIQQLEMNNSQLKLQREKDESELEYAQRLLQTREAKVGNEILVLAKDRISILPEGYEIVAEHKGSEMVGMEYEPVS